MNHGSVYRFSTQCHTEYEKFFQCNPETYGSSATFLISYIFRKKVPVNESLTGRFDTTDDYSRHL